MAKSVDSDLMASEEAIRSGSTLFAKHKKNPGSARQGLITICEPWPN